MAAQEGRKGGLNIEDPLQVSPLEFETASQVVEFRYTNHQLPLILSIPVAVVDRRFS